MKKAIFALAMLLVLGLLVTGCSKQKELDDQVLNQAQNNGDAGDIKIDVTEEIPEVYIDEQIIDEDSSIEIGEMI